jgi:tetratricopeptide (TPR) repeat protein
MRWLSLLLAAGSLFGQSIQGLTAQIQKGPTASLFFDRGSAYLEAGDAKQAIADFDRVLEREPVHGRALTLRAKAHAQLGNHQNAITDLSGAIALAPADADLYLARGDAYAAAGDGKRAVADREEAMRLSPEAYNAWASQPAEAPASASAPVEPKPEPVKAKPVEAKVASPRPVEAKTPSAAVAIASTGSADSHYLRARDLLNKGQYAEGMAEINQAIQMAPQNATFYNTRGYGYYLAKNFKQAIVDFNEALRLEPNYLNATHNLALAYRNAGDRAGYNTARQRELDLEKKSRAK